MKNLIRFGAACLVVILSANPQASADIFVNETFSHADGNLVGRTPTPGPGNAWAAHSGAGNKPIQVSSGEILLEQSAGSGEDANSGFTAIGATDTIYARFDFRLPSGQTVDPDGSGLYFAHFGGFRGRTGVLSAAGGGDFAFAINADNSDLGAGSSWASDLSFDTSYRTIISYNAATGESRLWLDPTSESSDFVSDFGATGTQVSDFSFRQSNDYTGSQVIDNLVVASTFQEAFSGVAIPEPSSGIVLLAFATGLFARRRR